MILLTLISSLLMAGMSIYQSREQAKDYHRERLLRKEQSIREAIAYQLKQTDFPVTTENLPYIFREEIYEISNIHSMPINIYDLRGRLLKNSVYSLSTDSVVKRLNPEIPKILRESNNARHVIKFSENNEQYQSSYTYILNNKQMPIGILNLPYLENDDFMNYELREFLTRLSVIYLLMFLISIGIAYLLARYITRSLRTISDSIKKLNLGQPDNHIRLKGTVTEEIKTVVTTYNKMVDQLEASAVKMAASERENAWREMAKQVAHEIKNPLTPMRLSVQSFEMRFDPTDPEIKEKLHDHSLSLLEQIDTMGSIASAFSNYADMPAQKHERVNVPEVVGRALEIFNEDHIHFSKSHDTLYVNCDRTQLIRTITNLVKNAIQATGETSTPEVTVNVEKQGRKAIITVADNGKGIEPENREKVFEPKFTTKSSGMGLGLAMVKQIVEGFNGNISLESTLGKGTTFTVSLPLDEEPRENDG